MNWIVVPNWEKFQHYTDRDPPWIKNYRTLLHDPDYLDLTLAARGVLHGIWLAYAQSGGQLLSKHLSAILGHPVDQQVKALKNAGFIQVSASRPLAIARARERQRKRKKVVAVTEPEAERDPEALRKIQALSDRIGL